MDNESADDYKEECEAADNEIGDCDVDSEDVDNDTHDNYNEELVFITGQSASMIYNVVDA